MRLLNHAKSQLYVCEDEANETLNNLNKQIETQKHINNNIKNVNAKRMTVNKLLNELKQHFSCCFI